MCRFWVAVFVAITPLCSADFEAGKQAFEQGKYEAALREWQPLAEQGLPFAAYNVALLYAKGQGVKQNSVEAAKWYRVAAEKGIPEAQYNLGVLYSSGTGVPKDEAQASQWFQKAAEKGDANAANSLGTLYEAGPQSLRNPAEAEKWYRKAAEEGNDDAQFNLGVMYDIGHGVKVDYQEAVKWYRKAADQWNDGALCNLAILYYNGEGVSRDLVEAHKYYLLAKEAGDERASNLIQLTTEKLSAKQIAQARQAADQFKRDHAAQIAEAANPVVKPPSPDSVTPSVVSAAQPESSQPGVWTGVSRVVAVGDLHGDYRQLVSSMRSAGLIDAAENWSGGKTHVVQTGDVVDQGPGARRIMDLLMKLEEQAKAAGGYVHCLLGNHEAMDLYGDLRFISPAGYQEYSSIGSGAMREQAYLSYRSSSDSNPLSKDEWLLQHPPGFVEQRQAFTPEGRYGRWLLSHDTVIRINNTLYSHAGIGPKYRKMTIPAINNKIREELAHPEAMAGGIATDLQGPLWYQGFAPSHTTADPDLEATLKDFGATRQVIGHVGAGAITPRFGGRVVLIDVGLSSSTSRAARQACLIEENGQLYALQQGTLVPLPKEEASDVLRYWKQLVALDSELLPVLSRMKLLDPK